MTDSKELVDMKSSICIVREYTSQIPYGVNESQRKEYFRQKGVLKAVAISFEEAITLIDPFNSNSVVLFSFKESVNLVKHFADIKRRPCVA